MMLEDTDTRLAVHEAICTERYNNIERTLRDGEAVTYSATKGAKGWSATKVQSSRVPTSATTPTA